MTHAPCLYELLYVSCIAPAMRVSGVGGIARLSRIKNAVEGITGLLVFDGERFAQQLEGQALGVRQLFDRILADPRHTQVHLLHQGKSEQRRFRRFSMGYADLGELEPLQALDLQEGQAAMDTFVDLVPAIDMEP